jgi:hypothetical protein
LRSAARRINEDTPAGSGLFEVTRTDVHGNAGRTFITNVRRLAGTERTPGSMVIMAMTWLLVVLDAGGKRRGLGIPVIADRALQALTSAALEPEWRPGSSPDRMGSGRAAAARTRCRLSS